MPPQQLHLSWKDHNGALIVVFENLLKSSTLVDCTLAAEGQYLKAHKVVLSACSSYFELLFSQESEKNPIVILKDVKFQELEAAVNFMYRGEVEVCEDRLTAFLEVADSLQIKGLGSEGRAQDLRGKSPTLKSPNVAVPPMSHSGKEVSLTQSENTGEISIFLNSDKNSNESSLHQQLLHRETSGSLPISSSVTVGSSFSTVPASTIPVGEDSHHDGELQENYQCSSSSVSIFPLGDSVPSDVDNVIKTEPATDTYLEEKSDESERDFGGVTMMEDQEDWGDPNIGTVGDDQATVPQDPGYSVAQMKTEESSSEHDSDACLLDHISSEDAKWEHGSAGSAEGPHLASVFKEQHPDVNFGRAPAPCPAPAPAPCPAPAPAPCPAPAPAPCPFPAPAPSLSLGPAPGTSSAPRRQGGARTGNGGGTAALAPRAGRFQCSQCDYLTNISSHWARHQFVHTGEKPFKCTVCSFATKQSCNLKIHMRKHTGEKPFKCTVCSYATSRSCNLKLHMRTHTGDKPFKCTLCFYAATQISNLKMHMCKHTGEKPFKCTLCSYATTQTSALKIHMRKHTGDKPFKCTVCCYAATQSSELKVHMRKHTGEKPFKCSVCSFASIQSCHLKMHMRRHTGEKPFKCTLCSYATMQSSNLKSHMKKHTQ